MPGCNGCKHLDYVEDGDSDGHVNWSNSGHVCMARHGVQNLKSFPFTKKEMSCYEGDEHWYYVGYRELFEKPERKGYTTNRHHAGKYTLQQALSMTGHTHKDKVGNEGFIRWFVPCNTFDRFDGRELKPESVY